MRKPSFYAVSVALLPLLVGMDGCLSKTVNHCVGSPDALGCPELCLDDANLEHCSELPDGTLIDGGACGQCTVNVPFCDEATLECAECTEEVGCECVADADCPDGAPVCGTRGRCGGCSESLDCAGRSKPVCDRVSGECISCSEDSQCAHLAATPVCDEGSGRCAECTVETEAAHCPAPIGEEFGPACDPVLLTCTGALRNSLGFCSPCISDSECGAAPDEGEHRCVPMLFDGAPHGNYCLLDLESHRLVTGDEMVLCPDRQSSPKLETSLLGVESEYCTVTEGTTTCEGVKDYREGPCLDDSECGAPGLDDGICQGDVCTYECGADRDCFGGTGSCDDILDTCTP